jgi:ATP-dependent protease ClpP protease subunit
MAKQVHIYIYGDIGEKGVTLDYVKGNLLANPDADEAIVHIRSKGGDVDEGFAIYDCLNTCGKKVTTIIEGLCASIATVTAMAGSTRIISPNADFMIHPAWADPKGMTAGNAKDYQEMANYISRADQRILDFYVKTTGKTADILKPLMDAETYMSASEAISFGFCTQEQEQLNAVAYLKIPKAKDLPNKNKMSLKSIMAAAKRALMAFEGIQASESTLTDGSMVYYAEDALTEGINVFTDAEMTAPVEDGDITLEDGTIISVVGGAVTSIVDSDSADQGNADTQALKDRIVALEAENTELKGLNNEAEVVITNMSTKLTGLANTRSTAKAKTSANNQQKFRTQAAEASKKKFSLPKTQGGN